MVGWAICFSRRLSLDHRIDINFASHTNRNMLLHVFSLILQMLHVQNCILATSQSALTVCTVQRLIQMPLELLHLEALLYHLLLLQLVPQ